MKNRLTALFVGLAFCSTGSAYYGTFDPELYRNVATITVVDTQAPNVECSKLVHPILAPLVLVTGIGCFHFPSETLYAPITIGPMWMYMFGNGLILPDQLLGHELSHAFRGDFHPTVLPFIESNRMRITTENKN